MANGIRAGGRSAGRLGIDVVAEVARLEADFAKIRKIVKDGSDDIARNTRAANDNLSNLSRGMAKTAPSAKMAAFGMKNLAFQAQDLGVQLAQAAGSSEPLKMALMAFVMQGPQIRDAFHQTGKSVFQLVAGFAAAHPILLALVAALGVAYGAIQLFASEIDKSGELDRYAQSLGLTKDEMAKLGDVGLTTGDVLKGLWRTIDQGLGASKVFGSIKRWAVDAFSTAINWIKNYAAASYAAMMGTSNAMVAMARAAKLALTGDLAGALELVKSIPAGYSKAFGDARKAIDGFFSNVKRNSIEAAKERIDADAAKIIDDRTEKKMKKEVKEKGSMLADVMSGAFLSQFSVYMQKHPLIRTEDIFAGLPTDLRDQVREIEDAAEGRQRVKDAEDYMDDRARDRFRRAANEFADIIGGKLGSILGGIADLLDRAIPDLTTAFGKFGEQFGAIWKNAGIGGAAANLTGGSGLGGTVGGALGSKLGEKFLSKGLASISTSLGQFAGPIGAIAGGVLGGVVGGLLKKTKKASATIEIMAGDAMQTSLTGNSDKLKKAAGAMADSLIGGLTSIADQLGGMLGDGIRVSIGQRDKTFRVDLQGLGRTKNMPKFDTQEEAVAYAIQQVIKQGAITGLRAGTEVLLKGEGDLEAQLQKAVQFEGVFRELADSANPARSSMESLTKEFNQLIEIFAEARASAADYAQLQELMAQKQRAIIEEAFEPIRSMLDDLKGKASDAGAAVRTAFDEVLSREADAVAAYEEAVAAKRQQAMEALQDQISTLRNEAKGFADAATKLRDFSASVFGAPSVDSLRANFARVAALAQGGNVDAMNDLPGVGQALRDAVVNGAGDRISMMRELNRIRSETDKAASVAEGRASNAERQAAALEAQLAAMQSVDETAVSIESLLADMQTAQAAADAAREQMKAFTELHETEMSFAQAVAAYEDAKAQRDDLIRQVTVAGFADLIAVQEKTGDQLISALSEAAIVAQMARSQAAAAIAAAQAAQAAADAQRAANDNLPWQAWRNGIPGFASGGSHRGGWRIVGEDGPELEETGPSRIFNAQQIASAMAGGASAEDIGRAVAAELEPFLYQISKNTGKTSDQLKRWDGDGMPEERSVA